MRAREKKRGVEVWERGEKGGSFRLTEHSLLVRILFFQSDVQCLSSPSLSQELPQPSEMQVASSFKSCAPLSSPASRRRSSNASSGSPRSSRSSGAVVVKARTFDVPKSDKFVPKRNPGAGDLRKLGSSDLYVSCKRKFGA